jgi:D-aminoacyl-tRNA deacylase
LTSRLILRREALDAQGVRVATGVFGARMAVELVNDGPVTIVL